MMFVKILEVKGKIRRDDPVPIRVGGKWGRHETGKCKGSMFGVGKHGHGHS